MVVSSLLLCDLERRTKHTFSMCLRSYSEIDAPSERTPPNARRPEPAWSSENIDSTRHCAAEDDSPNRVEPSFVLNWYIQH
jgi:hypothetical protein